MNIGYRWLNELDEDGNTLMLVSLLSKPANKPFPKRFHWVFFFANIWEQEEIECIEAVLVKYMTIEARHYWHFYKQEVEDGYEYIGELHEVIGGVWKPALARSAEGLAEMIEVSYHLSEFPH